MFLSVCMCFFSFLSFYYFLVVLEFGICCSSTTQLYTSFGFRNTKLESEETSNVCVCVSGCLDWTWVAPGQALRIILHPAFVDWLWVVLDKLHLLVAATFGQRPRPFAIGLTFWPLRRPRSVISVRLDLYEARPALHAQVIARIVVELEGRNEAVGRVARIGTLRFA